MIESGRFILILKCFCVLKRTKNKTKNYFEKSKRETKAHNGVTFPSLGVCTKLVMMMPEDVLA
jgi:hypothetical protein